MKQYYYLPKHYEVAIAPEIDRYLNTGGDFTIITGVYKEFDGIVDTTNSLVYSKIRTGEIVNIKNGYQDLFGNRKYELVGFCMEGNFQVEVPDLYLQIQEMPDCYIFDTASQYLEFIKEI